VQRYYKRKYISTKNLPKLSLVGIDPLTDNPVVHPAYFCHGCYTTLARKEEDGKGAQHNTSCLLMGATQ
jgi:hypothetical protein